MHIRRDLGCSAVLSCVFYTLRGRWIAHTSDVRILCGALLCCCFEKGVLCTSLLCYIVLCFVVLLC